MAIKHRLVIAGALLATVFGLVTAGSAGGSSLVTKFSAGFELRRLPRDWICCTPLKDLSSFAESKKVLLDFANGENDQKQKITLSPASITVIFTAGSGELCRYIENDSTGTVLTSPDVKMMKGTIFEYYAKKSGKKTKEGRLAAYEDLKKAIAKEGGVPSALAWFKMMIVEKTPEGVYYVGAPIRPY